MNHGQSRGKLIRMKKNKNREGFIYFAEIVGNRLCIIDLPGMDGFRRLCLHWQLSPSEGWRSQCAWGRFAGFFCLLGLSRICPRSSVRQPLCLCRGRGTLIILRLFYWSRYRDSLPQLMACGTWWRLGWVDSFQPEGRGFDSRSSRQVGTLGKSFTCSCLCASAWNSDTVSVR